MRLLNFKVKNYKSFNDTQEVTFKEGGQNVTAFYGPNSSGKTNLFKALEFYCNFILHSTEFRRQRLLSRDYFQYIDENAMMSTEFEAEFRTNRATYRYGFSISRDGNVDVERLQLRRKNDKKYETVFARKSLKNNCYEEYGFSSKILSETRPDALVLTRAYNSNNAIAKDVVSGVEKIVLFSALNFHGYTAERVFDNPELKEKVLMFLKMADLYIQDFDVKRSSAYERMMEPNKMLNEGAMRILRQASYDVITTHMLRDKAGNVVGVRNASLELDESSGTNRVFDYAVPIIEALEGEKVLYIDELEVNLHPRECAFIVNLFNSKNELASGKGQLIINTHETSLIDILGKENVYLLGKDRFEATVIGRIEGVRSDDKNLAKKYNAGMFGAVPRVGIR